MIIYTSLKLSFFFQINTKFHIVWNSRNSGVLIEEAAERGTGRVPAWRLLVWHCTVHRLDVAWEKRMCCWHQGGRILM